MSASISVLKEEEMTRQRLAAEQEESRKRQLELERRTQAENEVATASETAKQKSNDTQKGKLIMRLIRQCTANICLIPHRVFKITSFARRQ